MNTWSIVRTCRGVLTARVRLGVPNVFRSMERLQKESFHKIQLLKTGMHGVIFQVYEGVRGEIASRKGNFDNSFMHVLIEWRSIVYKVDTLLTCYRPVKVYKMWRFKPSPVTHLSEGPMIRIRSNIVTYSAVKQRKRDPRGLIVLKARSNVQTSTVLPSKR